MIFVKNSRGGQHDQHFVKNRVGGGESTSICIMFLNILCFFRVPLIIFFSSFKPFLRETHKLDLQIRQRWSCCSSVDSHHIPQSSNTPTKINTRQQPQVLQLMHFLRVTCWCLDLDNCSRSSSSL